MWDKPLTKQNLGVDGPLRWQDPLIILSKPLLLWKTTATSLFFWLQTPEGL